ncbi:hypothetical protein [Microcoleus vaginatus]|uniref:hypothetical protein n=1 Tax=Microcoleus vaginatus TaxID=119532 RepID=UPI001F60F84B|nr:hypothetical protein D0A37_20305 [Microcoleus vaginatus HSN003]
MFKRLIAVILALVLVLGCMEKPAYAYSEVIPLMNLEGSNTGSLVAISSAVVEEAITNELVKPAVEAAVAYVTVVAICMGADSLAASVFPPAAALLPYCPGVGGAFAGGVAVGETPVKGVVKSVLNLAR